jgi:hypothetical protein
MDVSLGTDQQREANTVDRYQICVYDIKGYIENLSNTYDLELKIGRVGERRFDEWETMGEVLESNDTATGAVVEVWSALGNAYMDIAGHGSEEEGGEVSQYSVRYQLNGRNGICSRILESGINAAGDPDNSLMDRAYRDIGENVVDVWRRCDNLLG